MNSDPRDGGKGAKAMGTCTTSSSTELPSYMYIYIVSRKNNMFSWISLQYL